MDFLKLLIYGVGILLIIKLLQYGLTWIRLMKRSFKMSHHRWVNWSDLPQHFNLIWEQANQTITTLGFQYAFSEKSTENKNSFSQVYIHPEIAVFAIISPTRLSGWSQPFDVIFVSIFDNGKQVITTDCLNAISLAYPENIQRNVLYVGDLNQQWQKHLESVNQIKANENLEPIYCTVEDYLVARDQVEEDNFSYLTKNGLVVPVENEEWRYSPIGAAKMLNPLFAAVKKIKSVSQAKTARISYNPINKKYVSVTTLPDSVEQAQIVADIAAFDRSLEHDEKKTQWSWITKSALFLLSVIVASLTFKIAFSWQTVVILLGVLLVHELGHLIGMRIFGFKDTQILFLPFLGAVTIGDKDDATPLQKIIIYLLGPVPGIIGGLVAGYVYLVTNHQIWYEISLMAIILNYINLLPILPLDGGKVLEALIFIRFPRVQTVLYIVNALVLVALYYFLNDRLIMFISISFFLAIPQQWLFGNAVAKVTKLLPNEHDRFTRLKAIFQVLKQPTFAKLSVPDRHLLTKKLLSHFSNAQPGITLMMIGTVMYVFLLGFPIYGVVGWVLATQRGWFSHVSENKVVEPINWEEKIKKAGTPDQKWEALIGAGDSELGDEEETSKKAEDYYLQALTIAETFPPNDNRYIDTLMKIASVVSVDKAETYYLQALEYAEKTSPNSGEVARVLEQLSYMPSMSKEKKMEYIERALKIRTEMIDNASNNSNINNAQVAVNNSKDNFSKEGSLETFLVDDTLALARIYQDSKDFGKAEELLKQLLTRTNNNEKFQNQMSRIVEELVDLYLIQGQTSPARQLLTEKLNLTVPDKKANGSTKFYKEHLATRLAWICILEKDLAAANKLFEQNLLQEQEEIKSTRKTIKTWLFSRIYGIQDEYRLIPHYLNLSYVKLQQGNAEAAKINFDEVKKILSSSKISTLDRYYKSKESSIQFAIQLAKKPQTQDNNKSSDIEDDVEFKPSAIDLNDPIVETLKQTKWRFQQDLAQKEVFDKFK